MSLVQKVRSLIPLVIGLAVGGAGATMYLQSMPGAVGSAEERASQLELELKKANNRLTAMEASESPDGGTTTRDAHGRVRRGRTLADGARSLATDIREGRPVTPQDIFSATKPLIRDLAPLFDRMRVKQQREIIDRMSGELARKYQLTPDQQSSLRAWFANKSNEEAARWTDLLSKEDTRLEDVMRASRDVRPDEGLEKFMEGVISGDKLAAFKTGQLNERAQQIQQAADTKVQRLDSIVRLDEAQRDQVFGLMARNSPGYDPTMVLEGAQGVISAAPASDPHQAMLGVLRADQRAAYEAERQRRRGEAVKDMEAMGLTLPPDWDPLEAGDL